VYTDSTCVCSCMYACMNIYDDKAIKKQATRK
jgi:hypothetical protein